MKVDFVAHEICKNVVAQLGHAISVKYLPSQVAAACLHLAKKQIIGEEAPSFKNCEIEKVTQYLDETMKILGYDLQSLQGIFAEINQSNILREFLGQRTIRKAPSS
jgi:hypothetical protein